MRLGVRRIADGLMVGFDSSSTQAVVVSVGHNMIVGMTSEMFYYDGAERVPLGGGPGQVELGLPNSERLEQLEAIASRQGVLQIISELLIFETDIPVQHNWRPEDGKYRELWRGISTGVLEKQR